MVNQVQYINALLNADPWVEYRTRLDLLGFTENDPAVKAARAAMLAHPLVKGLVKELYNWPGKVVNSHKSCLRTVQAEKKPRLG